MLVRCRLSPVFATNRSAFWCLCRVAGLCSQHSQAEWHAELRRVACDCLMRLALALQGLDSALTFALDAVAHETAPLVR